MRRYEEVSCNGQGRDLASFVREVEEVLGSRVSATEGIPLSLAGVGEEQERATREIEGPMAMVILGGS